MKTTKKVLSLVLALLMCFGCLIVPTQAATFNDINQSGIFVKQQTNYTCTLAAAVMLVRRTAMAAGNNNWSSITESSMRGTAWLEGSGLYYNFTYSGVSVGHSSISSNRKSNYINLLKTYPQGVVAYNQGNGNQWHAILLTDYDANTDTFYCSDPANGTASGRIPLSSSSIVGSGQDGKINNLNEYWYVKSPSITLTSNEPTKIVYPTNGGIYKIASGVGNNMYLDFACTNNNVQIYENCDGHSNPDFVKSQYYKLTHVGDGWYTITNPANGKAMDVYDWRTAPETNIQQWDLHSGDCQLFRFYDAGDGYCYIKSKLGTYVDVQNGDNFNNTNVWAYSFNGSNAQKWKLQSHSHSYNSSVTTQPTCANTGIKAFACYCGVSYTETINKIDHTNSWDDNKCDNCGTVLIAEPTIILYPDNDQIVKIETAVGSAETIFGSNEAINGSGKFLNADLWSDNIRIYENLDGNSDLDLVKSQYFKLTHIGDGWYTITNIGNGKAVDVAGANPATYTNVQQWECLNNDAQLFRFYDAGNGYCYIKSKLGCCVDVSGGQNANNANVWMHTFNGATAQKWKLHTHLHSYTSSVTTQPTCTKEGVRTYKCSCGTTYTETIARTSHNSNTIISAVAATCTKTGLTEGKKCSSCGTVTVAQQTVAKKAHSEVIDNAVASTCNKTGLTQGKHCSVCGTVTVAQNTVATVSHIDNNGDYQCDYNCGYEFDKPEDLTPDTPNEPDTPEEPAKKCSCNCHKSGLIGIIWKILRFFYKLFKINPVCGCGVAHY